MFEGGLEWKAYGHKVEGLIDGRAIHPTKHKHEWT